LSGVVGRRSGAHSRAVEPFAERVVSDNDPRGAGKLDSARTLRALVDELRAEPAPQLDFEAMEHALLARIDASGEMPESGAEDSRVAASRDIAAVGGEAAGDEVAVAGRSPAVPMWAPVEEHCEADSQEDAPLGEPLDEESLRDSTLPAPVRIAKVDGAAGAHASSAAGSEPAKSTETHGVRKAWAGWAVAAAAALLLGLPAGLDSERGTGAPVVVHDLAELAEGDVIDASEAAVTFGVPGVVTWTLEKGGRLVVQDDVAGAHHVVALERGSIRAEVTPRPERADGHIVESFAVEVAATRVAVRGTVFSVTRAGPGLIVDVEKGAVAVGQVGSSGLTEGRLLVASERASFSLDGGRSAKRLAPPLARSSASLNAPLSQVGSAASGPSIERGAEASEPARGSLAAAARGVAVRGAARSEGEDGAPYVQPDELAGSDSSERAAATALAPAGGSKGAASVAPSAGVPASGGVPATSTLTVDHLRAGLIGCFARVYEARPEASVHLSVSTVFHLSVQADGSIQSARFVPPLRPEMAECAGQLIAGRFERGPQQLQIPIQFQIGDE
jgi:hypothetical protein